LAIIALFILKAVTANLLFYCMDSAHPPTAGTDLPNR
jgi:hypothetical protein